MHKGLEGGMWGSRKNRAIKEAENLKKQDF